MQQNPEFLTVTRLGEIKADKNGREYRQVFFKGNDVRYIQLPNGKFITAKQEVKETSINAYSKTYLDDKPSFAWGLNVNDVVLGSVVTREVMPYDITDQRTGEVRTVNTYSRIVFGDTTSPAYNAAVKREFSSQGHPVVEAEQAFVTPQGEDEEMF
jgi:hypothetical protein